jgi:signal peptidase I
VHTRDPFTGRAPEPAAPPPLTRRERLELKRRKKRRARIEWAVVIGAAIVIAFVLRAFVAQTFYIPSDSMAPTLQRHDRVIVNKLSYRLHAVHRGDVVVFTTPPGVNETFKDLVKRVIALPSETVQGRDGRVVVNGKPLAEPYLRPGTRTADFPAFKVPADSYWVMGDNRSNSEDSRIFRAIPEDSIVGRVFVRIWPPKRIDLL